MGKRVIRLRKTISFSAIDLKPAVSGRPFHAVFQADLQKAADILSKLFANRDSFEDPMAFFRAIDCSLPLVRWTKCSSFPSAFIIYLLCVPSKEEPPLLEMVQSGLGGKGFVTSFWQQFFYINGRLEKFYLGEVRLFVEDALIFEEIRGRMPQLAKEIVACVSYRSSVRQFLEASTLNFGKKMDRVHSELVRLLSKFPKEFDPTLFQELSQFHALAPREVKEGRPSRHLVRLICSLFFIRRKLLRDLALFPQKRHLYQRLIPTQLRSPFGTSCIMGIVIGVSLFDKYELLEDSHVISAIQKLLPGVSLVKGSYYQYQPLQESFRLLYLEIEKKNGVQFAAHELRIMRVQLTEELKKRVAQLIPSIFMIRNEEEVFKNILLLSRELRFAHDLPQVMILFDYHQSREATFTVILMRLIGDKKRPIEEAIRNGSLPVRIVCERVQIVGYIDEWTKEASVLRVILPEDPTILRQDSSLNLFLARQKVMALLNDAMGEVRDYNGGMLLKQRERLQQFKELFLDVSTKDPELIEAFFYSLTPIDKQTTLPLSCLETLFSLFMQATNISLSKKEEYCLKMEKGRHGLFAMVRAMDNSFIDVVNEVLEKRGFEAKALVTTSFCYEGSSCRGFFYESFNDSECASFGQALAVGLSEWQKKMAQAQILRLSFVSMPMSLDPRLGVGDDYSHMILRMLFDGLMRLGKDGKPYLAVAKSVDISIDGLQYLFTLRDSCWSDGSKVTAFDFEYSWKTILSAHFQTPYAYMFYPIKNAQAVKEGRQRIEDLGIRVLDDKRLQVDLEHPAPYFLELTAHTLYVPVSKAIDQTHLQWAAQEGKSYVCNGPFVLTKQDFKLGCELIRNPHYWDASSVHLDRISITKNNAKTAKEMFNYDQNDWLGEPLHPWEDIFGNEIIGDRKLAPSEQVSAYWYEFNTLRFPFNNIKLRKAFAIAINRGEILKTLNHRATPALSPLPVRHSQRQNHSFIDGDLALARQLFEEGLLELNLSRKDFPIYTLNFSETRIRREMAFLAMQQWEEAFGIKGRIEGYPWDELLSKNLKGDFQICGVVWSSWIDDPIYTLQNFRSSQGGVNSTGWDNNDFRMLLDKAEQEADSKKRLQTYSLAEKVLLDEMPVIPLFHEYLRCIQKEHLKGVIGYETGSIDFKWAYISKT